MPLVEEMPGASAPPPLPRLLGGAEIRQIAPDWVLARTNSAGRTKNHATGAEGPEANQELFLFQKIGGDWKIARYCFCTTNPPRS